MKHITLDIKYMLIKSENKWGLIKFMEDSLQLKQIPQIIIIKHLFIVT